MIDFAAIADLDDENNEPPILKIADRTKVADAIFPERAERAGQAFAERSLVVDTIDPL